MSNVSRACRSFSRLVWTSQFPTCSDLTLSRRTTYIYIYIYMCVCVCGAVSPLNGRMAIKVDGGGGDLTKQSLTVKEQIY